MFFFFDSENSPKVSYLAFETYVIEILRKYVEAQGKTLLPNNGNSLFNAHLPDGIDDIPGPVNVEIKYFDTPKKNIYFQSLVTLSDKINKADDCSILLILGDNFTEKSIESMMNLLKSRTTKAVNIWSLSTFYNKTHGYRDGDFTDISNLNSVLVDAAINNDSSEHEMKVAHKAILEDLKSKYKSEELVLFLGAGVSIESGIPLWNELVNSLLAKMIASRFKKTKISTEELNAIINIAYRNQSNSSITQMRYIRSAFDNVTYNKLVHDALYSGKPTIKSNMLKAISSICTPTRNHIGVQGIVTYNFDDLIERRLTNDNVAVNPIYDESGHSLPNKLSIFHVHGFLPKRSTEEGSCELIFSEEDYHRVYRDAYCWSNIVQLNYLRENSCLFIGCSLTDPNLRRLLDVAARSDEKPRHFAILRKPHITDTPDISKNDIETYRKIDMGIKEKCFSTMGINIIWVDDFSDIQQILQWLKE